MRHRWSPDDERQLTELVKAGLRLKEIAPKLSKSLGYLVTEAAVASKLGRMGIVNPPHPETVKPADLYRLLAKSEKVQLIELASQLNVSTKEVRSLIAQLKDEGYNITLSRTEAQLVKQLPIGNRVKIDVRSFSDGKWYRFGIVSDTHLGSRYAREDVLQAAYDHFQREKIGTVYLPGNLIDGYRKKINHYDLLPGLTGYTNQVEYAIKNFPQRKGITTYFITGDDHEGWWASEAGINIGEYIQLKAEQAGRQDLIWLGHMEADVELSFGKHSSIMRVVHPGGGTAYAKSYSTQKLVESYQGGEKPTLLVVGHFHKALYDYCRNVYVIQAAACQDQTPFMRKHKLASEVGFWVVEFHQASSGEINRLKAEFFPSFDQGFYLKNDRYKRW